MAIKKRWYCTKCETTAETKAELEPICKRCKGCKECCECPDDVAAVVVV